MMLGALGVLAGLLAPLNLLVAKKGSFMGPAGASPEMEALQERLLEAAMPELTVTLGVLNLVVSGWVLWTAIRLMMGKPHTRRPFCLSLEVLGAYEILALLAGLYVQSRTWGMMEELVAGMARSTPGGATEEAEAIMGTTMKVSVMLGVVIAVVWGGAKIAFLIWARTYASTPEVVRHLGE